MPAPWMVKGLHSTGTDFSWEKDSGRFMSSGTTFPARIFSRMCMVRRSDLDMQVKLTRFSLMPAGWQTSPHSTRGILEKQYSFLECLSMTSWWWFMHSLPLRDSDPEIVEM